MSSKQQYKEYTSKMKNEVHKLHIENAKLLNEIKKYKTECNLLKQFPTNDTSISNRLVTYLVAVAIGILVGIVSALLLN